MGLLSRLKSLGRSAWRNLKQAGRDFLTEEVELSANDIKAAQLNKLYDQANPKGPGLLSRISSAIEERLPDKLRYPTADRIAPIRYSQEPSVATSKIESATNKISDTIAGPINERIAAMESPANIPTEFTNKTKKLQSLNTVNRVENATVNVTEDSFNLVEDKYKNLADDLGIDEINIDKSPKALNKEYSDFHTEAINNAKIRTQARGNRVLSDAQEAYRTDADFWNSKLEEGGSFQDISNEYKTKGIDEGSKALDFGSTKPNYIELKDDGINVVTGKPLQKKVVKTNAFFEDGIDLTKSTRERYQNITKRYVQQQSQQAEATQAAASGKTKLKSNRNPGTPDNSTDSQFAKHAGVALAGLTAGVGLTYALTRNHGQQSNAQLYGQQPLY